jgi:hypothetical protein
MLCHICSTMNAVSLTQSETELLAYVAAKNAETNARAKAEGFTFWTNIPDDIGFFRSIGVASVAEYEAWQDETDRQEAEKEERKSWFN